MASLVEFQAALSRYKAEKLGKIGKAVQVEVAKRLGTKIVYKTPVKTGRARGNWRLAIGSRLAKAETGRKDPNGAATVAAIVASAARLAAYSSFTIYNNVPYVPRLEDGWSLQAPMGMIRLSLREVLAERSGIVAELQKALGKFRVR